MLIIDTHAHLNDPAYDKDRGEVIKRAFQNNIWVINVGSDEKTSEWAVQIADENKEGVFAVVGIHPHNAEGGFDVEEFRALINRGAKVVAVGEIGLDYSRIKNEELGIKNNDEPKIKERQKEIFKKQIELALELNKPIVIHSNKAHEDVLEILKPYALNPKSRLRGVAHSFLGNYKQARRYRELGFKISVNGIITYARDYDKMILDTPIEDILIETDCPYLTPVPHKGERNEPLYVIEVAKKLAELKSLPYKKVIEITTENAREVFGM
ncbi:MAG: TatD family hydrolase [Candidatus Wolfebacteria bacterium]|nr:TatD family hydrolase [Candidatus Wolfebacteria bacterium]